MCAGAINVTGKTIWRKNPVSHDILSTRDVMTIERKPFLSPAWNAAVVALLAGALYAVSLGGTYVYDDVPVVQHDSRLQPKVRWGYLWTRGYNRGVDRLYRPLVTTSYAIEWWLHGDRPWVFHLVNILLHAACSVCVAELARRMLGSRVGLAAGLLFAAHPVHVEAVANIVGRAELACGLGIAAALMLALKPINIPRALAISGCFVVAVLSKEQGLLLPLLILLLLVARRLHNPQQVLGTRNGLLVLAAMLLWLLSGYLIWREEKFGFWWDRNDMDWTINPLVRSTGLDRWLVPIEILGRYAALLIVPFKLSVDYGANVIEPQVHYQQPYFFVGVAVLVGWCVAVGLALKKRKMILLFLLVALAMTYGLVGNMVMLIGTSMGERLMYTPSAFLTILLACGLSALMQKRIPYAMVLVVLIGLGALRTVTYAIRWNDALALFESATRAQPASVHAQLLLGDEYRIRGQLDKADEVNMRAVGMLDTYWYGWFQRGQVAAEKKEYDRAQMYFEKSMEIQPNSNAYAWLVAELPRRRAATQRAATSQP
jgi:protein O-mannosyl-transferase